MNIVGTIGIVKADATDTFIAGSDKLTGGISRLSCASEPVAQAVTQIFHPRRARANPKKGRSKIAALQVAIPDRDVFYVAVPTRSILVTRHTPLVTLLSIAFHSSALSWSFSAAMFSSRCASDDVPGIGNMTGDFCSNHASASCTTLTL